MMMKSGVSCLSCGFWAREFVPQGLAQTQHKCLVRKRLETPFRFHHGELAAAMMCPCAGILHSCRKGM